MTKKVHDSYMAYMAKYEGVGRLQRRRTTTRSWRLSVAKAASPRPGGLVAADRIAPSMRVGRVPWLTLAIVVLMAVNVVLRYPFSVGSVWSQELEWHLLAPLILFGITYALARATTFASTCSTRASRRAARRWSTSSRRCWRWPSPSFVIRSRSSMSSSR